MEDYQYRRLIDQLEIEADRSPARFRAKVYAITALAYIALFVALGALTALLFLGFNYGVRSTNAYVLFKLGLLALFLVPLLFVVLRVLVMRLPPPEGIPVTATDAPRLFALLEEMRGQLQGPPIHRVLVDGEFNAAIAQVPRFGLFGGHRNYLVLGMPYLGAVTAAEMHATLAHEYGHLAGNHGKMAAWVYRQRRAFGALREHLAAAAAGDGIDAWLAAAIDRFAPYFNAYTFVLSRRDEYDADRTATELVGAAPNASGLIRGALIARWLREAFWPRFDRQVDLRPQPAHLPHAAMGKLLLASYGQWARPDWLAEAWRVNSDVFDTHPCLRERVEATGQVAALPAPVRRAAADELLGPLAVRLTAELDRLWWERVAKGWGERYQRITRGRARARQLLGRPLEELKLDEAHELAMLHMDLGDVTAARPVLEHLLSRPGGPFPRASHAYGRILLDAGDDRGLRHLEDAARAERPLANDCARAGYRFLHDARGKGAAEAWLESLQMALA